MASFTGSLNKSAKISLSSLSSHPKSHHKEPWERFQKLFCNVFYVSKYFLSINFISSALVSVIFHIFPIIFLNNPQEISENNKNMFLENTIFSVF